MSSNTATATLGIDYDQRSRRRRRVALVGALIILILVLLALGWGVLKLLAPTGVPAAGTVPTGITWVRSTYGYGRDPAQQLYRPNAVAVGPDGSMWVTDPSQARILAFNPDGTFRTMIHQGPPSLKPGKLQRPDAVAMTGNSVYVADYARNVVMQFTTGNQFVREWYVPAPLGMAVKNGRIAVSTAFGVALYDLRGKLLTLWGTRGSGPDQFDLANGVAIADDGTIYVSDTQNARVKAYTSSGKLLWISGGATKAGSAGDASQNTTGSASNPFQLPAGMTIDGRGRIVVVDPFNFTIDVLDPARKGAVVAKYGEFGGTDGMFAYPTGIAYDAKHDWFVVADTDNDRAQVLRLPGSAASPLKAGIQRALLQPLWILLIPAVLVLSAGYYMLRRRRRWEYVEIPGPPGP